MGLVGPVFPVLLLFLTANMVVGLHALCDFQMYLMYIFDFTLPAAYSAKEEIASQKKSKQGQQL